MSGVRVLQGALVLFLSVDFFRLTKVEDLLKSKGRTFLNEAIEGCGKERRDGR